MTARLLVLRVDATATGATKSLRVVGPEYDACFMPLGHDRLCMLPGTHVGGCLPAPVTYPPTVTVAVAS